MKFLSNVLIKAGLLVEGAVEFTNLYDANVDTDKFLVSDGGIIKYRTGSQLLSDIGGQASGSYVETSRALTINGVTYNLGSDRTWSVGTVTNISALTIGTNGTDLSSTVINATTTPVITLNIPTASSTNRGVLSSSDWNVFNNKQNAITLTTSGTSGVATFISNILNIPNYGSVLGNYLPLAGGIMTGQIVLSVSSSSTDYSKGLKFPDDPFGGVGDRAGVRLYEGDFGSTEDQVLEMYVKNDDGLVGYDKINFSAPTNNSVTVNGYPIWSTGNLASPQSAITLTTNGYSGASTFSSNVLNIPNYGAVDDGVISGGIVTWTGTGLVFTVSVCNYYINGVNYTSPLTSITLDAADPTFDRIDVFAVNTSGQVVVIKGTPSSNPVEPEGDTTTTIGLTNVTVTAGSTTPNQAVRNLIYDENVETWTQTIVGGTGFSYNNVDTTQFYTFTKSFKVIQGSQYAQLRFSKAVAMDIRDYKSLSFAIRLDTAWTNQTFQISFYNGTTRTALYTIGNTNVVGFNRSLANQWQFVTLNLALFSFNSNAFTGVQIFTSGSNRTYWVDTVSLNGGINNPTGTTSNSFGFVNGSTGSAAATISADTLSIVGTGLATTSATGKTLTIEVPTPIPSQTGNTGKYLTTNGSIVSWGDAQSQLNGTGFVKASGTTISYDNSTYLTANQSISITGAVTGSGTTAITTTLANSVVGISNLSATGTPSSTTYLRGDNTWATVSGGSNIYNADGTLTAARTLTHGGFNLSFVGSSFTNRFTSAGRLLLGTTTESTFILDIVGNSRVSGDMIVNGFTVGRGNNSLLTNYAFGLLALSSVTTGTYNIGLGEWGLKSLTTGQYNIGIFGLSALTSGSNNIGIFGLDGLISGSNNIAIGRSALSAITTANNNTAVGWGSMSSATSSNNVAIGFQTLQNTSGQDNTAIGPNAMKSSTSGGANTASGSFSLTSNTTGSNNAAFGVVSLQFNISGSNNVGIGGSAGSKISGGSTNLTISNNSIFIGYGTKALADNQTNQIVIGYNETGLGSNTTIIGNSSTILTALRGNITIGTTSVDASSQLQVDSTTKGFLPPRMTSTQRVAIGTPATGLLVYQTDATEGLYQYLSTGWSAVSGGGGGGTDFYTTDGTLTSARTLTHGGFNLSFVGSSFTNRFTSAGRLLLGTTTEGTFLLDVNADARINGLTIGKGTASILTNTAIGIQSLLSNTTGNFNTAIGYQALYNVTTSVENTAIGLQALYNCNTSLGLNTAIGKGALNGLTTGERNVAIGRDAALIGNISNSVIIGQEAGTSSTGLGTIAIGFRAGRNISGTSNIVIGYSIANGLISGASNLLLNAGNGVTTGSYNYLIGGGNGITTGSSNICIGSSAFGGNGDNNISIGEISMLRAGTRNNNISIGYRSLGELTTGSNNTAIGYQAGYQTSITPFNNTTGNNSIFIGYQARPFNDAQTNQIVIGYTTIGLGSNTTILGNSSTTLTALYGSTIINAISIDASAVLQADSTTKGFLPPRMTTTQKNAIATPAAGLIVYDTTLNKLCVRTASTWETITSA